MNECLVALHTGGRSGALQPLSPLRTMHYYDKLYLISYIEVILRFIISILRGVTHFPIQARLNLDGENIATQPVLDGFAGIPQTDLGVPCSSPVRPDCDTR